MNRLVERFLFEPQDVVLRPRFNIAPTQPVAVVRQDGSDRQRTLAMLRWGLIPSWAKDAAVGNRLINARGETVSEKPSFRSAFKQRRCLILADGYYEWQKPRDGGAKRPHFFHLVDDAPFAMAGLWERWQSPEGPVVETCTIITTGANELAGTIHDRMPVILRPEAHVTWLTVREQDPRVLSTLLMPYPAEFMAVFPVGTTVNNPRNETPECLLPPGVP